MGLHCGDSNNLAAVCYISGIQGDSNCLDVSDFYKNVPVEYEVYFVSQLGTITHLGVIEVKMNH